MERFLTGSYNRSIMSSKTSFVKKSTTPKYSFSRCVSIVFNQICTHGQKGLGAEQKGYDKTMGNHGWFRITILSNQRGYVIFPLVGNPILDADSVDVGMSLLMNRVLFKKQYGN